MDGKEQFINLLKSLGATDIKVFDSEDGLLIGNERVMFTINGRRVMISAGGDHDGKGYLAFYFDDDIWDGDVAGMVEVE